MNNIPPMYVQDVKEAVHINSISENGTDVKRKIMISRKLITVSSKKSQHLPRIQ